MSLCFDGGTGAYEEALMGDSHIGPFNLMLNIQIGKTLLAAILLIVGGEINAFMQLANEQAFSLMMLGTTGACGQVFIFLTIAKFGALTCSVIGLARKIITLVLSLIIYQHPVTMQQSFALALAVSAMILNFMDKRTKKKKKTATGDAPSVAEKVQDRQEATPEEREKLTDIAPESEDLSQLELEAAVSLEPTRRFCSLRAALDKGNGNLLGKEIHFLQAQNHCAAQSLSTGSQEKKASTPKGSPSAEISPPPIIARPLASRKRLPLTIPATSRPYWGPNTPSELSLPPRTKPESICSPMPSSLPLPPELLAASFGCDMQPLATDSNTLSISGAQHVNEWVQKA
eukprot:scaffold7624_cov248-Pinguiococcus_pyrenoidosus.AAC.4